MRSETGKAYDEQTSLLRRAEIGGALLITVAAVWLHWIAAVSAGRLWRDEAAGVEVANLPTLTEMWNNMQYDSFPVLWLLLARTVGTLAGPANDTALRALGFAVGLALVGVLWICARAFRHSFPLMSLPLLALAPSVIIWGDSARAYGLAMVLMLLTGALIWRFVDRPGVLNFIAATIGAIASVHVVFWNSVILFAVCAGGAAVCSRKGAWNRAAIVLLVGVLAAITLLPYAGLLRDAGTWRDLAKVPEYSLPFFLVNLDEVLGSAGRWATLVWIQLFALGLFAGWRALRTDGQALVPDTHRDVALFSIVTMTVGVVAYLLFLENLSYYPSPWYYLPLLALIAVCIDALSGALVRTPRGRIARLAVAMLLAGATIFPAMRAVRRPLTNVDRVAARLQLMGRSGDLVLVNPWFIGVSFYRYYRGVSPWMTVPPIGVHAFHRYDLIKQKMTIPDQAAAVLPVLQAIEKTLTAGGQIFIVGRLHVPAPDQEPIVLPPVQLRANVWPEGEYRQQWSLMVGHFLQRHASALARVPVSGPGKVSAYENLHLIVAKGWRP